MSDKHKPSAELDPADLYVPPTPLAAAIQYPLDRRWPGRVLNAYINECKRVTRAALEARS